MSADELRQAAETLRERAEAATPGPWSQASGMNHLIVAGDSRNVVVARQCSVANAPLVATMHPGVALALADVLDVIAYVKEFEPTSDYFVTTEADSAMSLARLINGGAS